MACAPNINGTPLIGKCCEETGPCGPLNMEIQAVTAATLIYRADNTFNVEAIAIFRDYYQTLAAWIAATPLQTGISWGRRIDTAQSVDETASGPYGAQCVASVTAEHQATVNQVNNIFTLSIVKYRVRTPLQVCLTETVGAAYQQTPPVVIGGARTVSRVEAGIYDMIAAGSIVVTFNGNNGYLISGNASTRLRTITTATPCR